MRIRLTLATTLIAITILSALTYATFAAYPLVRGPELMLDAPHYEAGTVTIRGSTVRISKVSINDLPIPLTEAGTFAIERAYPPGYTVVTVRAEDRFGRTRSNTLTFVIPPRPL